MPTRHVATMMVATKWPPIGWVNCLLRWTTVHLHKQMQQTRKYNQVCIKKCSVFVNCEWPPRPRTDTLQCAFIAACLKMDCIQNKFVSCSPRHGLLSAVINLFISRSTTSSAIKKTNDATAHNFVWTECKHCCLQTVIDSRQTHDFKTASMARTIRR